MHRQCNVCMYMYVCMYECCMMMYSYVCLSSKMYVCCMHKAFTSAGVVLPGVALNAMNATPKSRLALAENVVPVRFGGSAHRPYRGSPAWRLCNGIAISVWQPHGAVGPLAPYPALGSLPSICAQWLHPAISGGPFVKKVLFEYAPTAAVTVGGLPKSSIACTERGWLLSPARQVRLDQSRNTT
jgi:hypothetical protein